MIVSNMLTLCSLFSPLTKILVQLQIEDASRRLRSGDLGIPANPEERFENDRAAGWNV